MRTKYCLWMMVIFAACAALIASQERLWADGSRPPVPSTVEPANIVLVAHLDGPDYVGWAVYRTMPQFRMTGGPYHVADPQYRAAPRIRIFEAFVQFKPMGPESSPSEAVICLERGAYKTKLCCVQNRHGKYSIRLDTQQSDAVPFLLQGDRIVFMDGQTGEVMCRGALKFPAVNP